MNLSKTEQDYMKAIYEFQYIQSQDEIVSLKKLAQYLQVAAPTVTEMVKRLEKKDLVYYQSYKGVSLTETGKMEALFMLKAHRVWESFLLNKLSYQENEVHVEAELLEHAASPMLIERLYEFLGNPMLCPHGNPIPQENFWHETAKIITLDEEQAGMRAQIHTLTDAVKEYFMALELTKSPQHIKIIQKLPDGTFIVKLDAQDVIAIPQGFHKDIEIISYTKEGERNNE